MAKATVIEVNEDGTLVVDREGTRGIYDPKTKAFTPSSAPQKPPQEQGLWQKFVASQNQLPPEVPSSKGGVPGAAPQAGTMSPAAKGALTGALAGGAAGSLPGAVIGGVTGALAPPQETAGSAGALVGGAAADVASRAIPGGGLARAGLRIGAQGLGTALGMGVENQIRKSLGKEIPVASGDSMWVVPVLSMTGGALGEGLTGVVAKLAKATDTRAVARAVNNLEGQAGDKSLFGLAERTGSRLLATLTGTEKSAGQASRVAGRMFHDLAPIKLSPEEFATVGSQLKGVGQRMKQVAKAASSVGVRNEEAELLSETLSKINPDNPAAMVKTLFGSSEGDQVRVIKALEKTFKAEGGDEAVVEQLKNEWLWQTVINPATQSSSTATGIGFGSAGALVEGTSHLSGQALLTRVNQLGSKLDTMYGPGRAAAIRDIATVMDLATAGANEFAGKGHVARVQYLGNKLMFAAGVSGSAVAGGAALAGSAVGVVATGVALVPLATVMNYIIKNPQASKQFLEAAKDPSGIGLNAFVRAVSRAGAATVSTEAVPPVARSK